MRELVIGYGNPSRRDDGVALAVVNSLRERLGKAPLAAGDDGYDDLGGEVDTLFLQQLNPELSETLASYDRVWFVDAHLGVQPEAIRRVPLTPGLDPALVSHHFKPEALLALAGQLYGHAPEAELVSVLGHDFDFGEALSAATLGAAQQLAETLWREIGTSHTRAPQDSLGDAGA